MSIWHCYPNSRNIAVVGANGNVGSYITSALLAKNHFNVTAITRTESKATFPSGVNVARIDYDSQDTIVKALTGQDALVITMSVFGGNAQEKLIRGAAQAGVPWILPNEFGMYNTEEIQNETIGPGKAIARNLIESLGVSSWIGVTSGFWYEYSLSGAYFGIDIPKREVVYFDDGKQRLNTATWPQTGLAVANLLSLPVSASDGNGPTLEQYRNRYDLRIVFRPQPARDVRGGTEGYWHHGERLEDYVGAVEAALGHC